MVKCCLCGNNRKLIKAHVIPEAFFRLGRVGNEIPYLISDTPNTHKKRSPIGVYDKGILCGQCEPKFSKVDDYGVKVLLKQLDILFLPILCANQIVAFQANSINQELLLRFFIAILWRASVSTHGFYKRIDLGAMEPMARESIINPNGSIPKQFSAVLFRWVSDDEKDLLATKVLMDPYPENLDNVSTYRFYFGEIGVSIKADEREFPKDLHTIALLNQPHIVAIARDFKSSKDFSAMVHTLKQYRKNLEKRT